MRICWDEGLKIEGIKLSWFRHPVFLHISQYFFLVLLLTAILVLYVASVGSSPDGFKATVAIVPIAIFVGIIHELGHAFAGPRRFLGIKLGAINFGAVFHMQGAISSSEMLRISAGGQVVNICAALLVAAAGLLGYSNIYTSVFLSISIFSVLANSFYFCVLDGFHAINEALGRKMEDMHANLYNTFLLVIFTSFLIYSMTPNG